MIEQAIIEHAIDRDGWANPAMGTFALLTRLAGADSADAACEALALFVAAESIGTLIVDVIDPANARCLRWTTLDAARLAAHEHSGLAPWLQAALPQDGRPGAVTWSTMPRAGTIRPDAAIAAALGAADISGGISATMALSDDRHAMAHILSDAAEVERLSDDGRTVFLVLASQAFLTLDRNLKAPNPARLTRREIEALRLAARGLTAADMAQAMKVTVATIRFHLMGARRKLRVRTTREAIATMQGSNQSN